VNLPELTAEKFLIDPFSSEVGARMYRTGDRARLRADYLIEFLGRFDDQVKINGFRIELAEIERALRASSLVREGAVSVASDDSGGKFLVAHVVAVPGSSLNARAVRDHLGATLPKHMVPHRILLVDALPKNSSGKLDRTELTRRASVGRDPVVPKLRRMRSEREAAISACWVDVLGNGVDADPNTNFFDAGGDSLRLLALHERLVRVLGIDIELLDLFAYPTVRLLVQALDARKVS
jgi:aryl carrier-like protein